MISPGLTSHGHSRGLSKPARGARIGRLIAVAALGLGFASGPPQAAVASAHGPKRGRKARSGREISAMPNDASLAPVLHSPTVVDTGPADAERPAAALTSGWTRQLLEPRFEDRRRRLPVTARPHAFGGTLVPGERFKFDVTFGGNPAGLAEAAVEALEPDPRGDRPEGAPTLRLTGHARTSGVVSLLATVTDDLVTIVDSASGAAVFSSNTLNYSGWAPGRYKHRVTEVNYLGRGSVRIEDRKDSKLKRKKMRVPIDTFDPLSAMAWVRSLALRKGQKAKAHAIDGSTLLRVEVESMGSGVPQTPPPIMSALELRPADVTELHGTLTRVDKYDHAIPGKRSYALRAWVSNDARRIPLVLESDMWVGAIRLELSAYDPPPRPAFSGDTPAGAPGRTPVTPNADSGKTAP